RRSWCLTASTGAGGCFLRGMGASIERHLPLPPTPSPKRGGGGFSPPRFGEGPGEGSFFVRPRFVLPLPPTPSPKRGGGEGFPPLPASGRGRGRGPSSSSSSSLPLPASGRGSGEGFVFVLTPPDTAPQSAAARPAAIAPPAR